MVLVEITRHGAAGHAPRGVVAEVLGAIDDPGVDTEIILRKHAIPDEHPPEVVAEAERIGAEVRQQDVEGRTDFRDRIVVTIDGEHARDFDDAISIERLPNGHYWLGVHIADVAHYVKPGTALDREAYERGTSVYFPERAVHMFPEALATGVCSLNPHVDRLVQSCLMEVTAKGDVVRHEMHDGIIRSTARMTYTAVNAILTDRDPEAIAAASRAGADVRVDAPAVQHPQRPAATPRAPWTSICPSRKWFSTPRASSRTSSRRNATSRTG